LFQYCVRGVVVVEGPGPGPVLEVVLVRIEGVVVDAITEEKDEEEEKEEEEEEVEEEERNRLMSYSMHPRTTKESSNRLGRRR
jgi:hypothetical protein